MNYAAYIILPALTSLCFFFFNDTATTEIYTLSLHDALPISRCRRSRRRRTRKRVSPTLGPVQLVAGHGLLASRPPLAPLARALAQGLGHRPHVGGDRAAAGPDVVVAHIACPHREVGESGSRERELLELVGELRQGDEVGLVGWPVKSDRLGRQVDVRDGAANLLYDGVNVLGGAQAV